MEHKREIDALVAQKVMGLKVGRYGQGEALEIILPTGEFTPIPRYSSSIEAAWLVVERLPALFSRINPATDGFLISTHMEQGFDSKLSPSYYVRFEFESCSSDAEASTLPEAICLAALKAVTGL